MSTTWRYSCPCSPVATTSTRSCRASRRAIPNASKSRRSSSASIRMTASFPRRRPPAPPCAGRRRHSRRPAVPRRRRPGAAARVHAGRRVSSRGVPGVQLHARIQPRRPARRGRARRDGALASARRAGRRERFSGSRRSRSGGAPRARARRLRAAACDCGGGGAMTETQALLRAESVQKRFGGVHALRSGDLEVFPGEVHALVGENGSGKSTLLKILSGQLQPDAGLIVLDGRVTGFRGAADALRQRIATVTQETTLAPDLSIAENVLLGRTMRRRHAWFVDWRRMRARARDALALLELDLDPSQPVRQLRPDLQQLVEIARALLIDARVLILD